MLTKRDNLLEAVRGGAPDRFVNQYEALALMFDPIFMDNAGPEPGEADKPDGFGVWYSWPEGQPGAFPLHSPEKKVLHDIRHWRDEVHAPRLDYSEAEWEPWVAQMEAIDRTEQFATSFVIPGIFEQCHHLMGVSEALTAFYEEPRAMKELIAYLVDWELDKARVICDHLHPDALFHHDDFGSYDSTFLAPEMFDEFFLEPYKTVYSYWRTRGVELVVHHSDSYAATLVPSMIAMGVDIWQGVMLSNDIPDLIGRYGGKMSFMGGLENGRIDVCDWSRAAIDAEVARVLPACGAHYFIPGLCAGNPESCVPEVFDEVTSAIERFNASSFPEVMELTLVRERERGTQSSRCEPAECSSGQTGHREDSGAERDDALFNAIARGKRGDAMRLAREQLESGRPAIDILNGSLIAAMDAVGQRFSAGEVFVPEMLMAARAMAAATETLKPALAEDGAQSLGKVAIGTVQGDMHDIGKNLVRMMLESKGFEVCDLGVDVAPEAFVSHLRVNPDTDIVCLSALLTTTMPAMEETMRALEDAGLRDTVLVMVGGAPVTEAFAESIGADAYTADASLAALKAAELVAFRGRKEGGCSSVKAPAGQTQARGGAKSRPALRRAHTPVDLSDLARSKTPRDMARWAQELIASPRKSALPIVSFPAIQLLDVEVDELLSSEELQSRALTLVAARTPSAAAVSFMDLSVEAEAFGSSVVYQPGEVPTVVGSLVSSQADLDSLKIPVVGDARTGTCVRAIAIAASSIVDRPLFAGLIGPFSLAGRLMDVNEVMVQCYEEPDLVRGVLEKATEFLIAYAIAFKEAGADGVVMAEPLAGLLPPDMMGAFSSEYVARIVDAVQDDGFMVVYHNCGPSVAKAPDAVAATGARAYHFGNAVAMGAMLSALPDDVLVMGNVDPASVLRNGTEDEVRSAVAALMEECAPWANFLPSTGCDVPPLSPWENIDAFFEAVEEYYLDLA